MIVGSWAYPMYEQAVADALTSLAHDVSGFSWAGYYRSIVGRAENKFSLVGPNTLRMNRDLIRVVDERKPDLILTWRATSIRPSVLQRIKRSGASRLASYNHDDFTGPHVGAPAPWHHRLHWRQFLAAARHYDHHFVKRESNVEHLRALGSTRNHIASMWFVPSIHRPVELTPEEESRFASDVVFVGHYEPDQRVEHLRALIRAGFAVRLFGGHYWTREVLGDLHPRLAPVQQAEGENYAKALCGAKVCLAFLSKLNRDTYTRRCFEIPACGRVMLAERTDDLLNIFKDDEEACFFSSTEELVEKARWLVGDRPARERIAQAGLRRVWADGRDIVSWTKSFLDAVAC